MRAYSIFGRMKEQSSNIRNTNLDGFQEKLTKKEFRKRNQTYYVVKKNAIKEESDEVSEYIKSDFMDKDFVERLISNDDNSLRQSDEYFYNPKSSIADSYNPYA
jgi:hypothetical protein